MNAKQATQATEYSDAYMSYRTNKRQREVQRKLERRIKQWAGTVSLREIEQEKEMVSR